MKNKFNYIFLLLPLILLAACTVNKPYSAPETPGNISYRDNSIADTSALMTWFELYQDTALQTIIKTTLDSNRDLLSASSRIEEARLQTAIIKANLYPRFDYTAKAGGGQAGTDARKVAAGVDGGLFNALGVFNWELDIWGKLKSQNRAAMAQYLAISENRNALQFSLVAEVASQYFLLRDLDNRLAIAKQTLVSRKESTKLITERYEKGYISEIDQLLAIQQESFAAAAIPNLQRQIVQTENALRLIMGMGPGPVPRGYSNFEQTLSPNIPVGLSSQLLARRPDIRASEKILNAQFEKIGVAEANRFPTLSLTGILGFASPQLSSFISGSGFVANGFGALTGPIFNFRQNRNLVEVEKQRTQQATLQYQQTVLSAFRDVDNALNNYRTFAEEYEQRTRQVGAATRSLELYRAKYDNGYTSYLEVTVQETNLFDAQLQQSLTLQGKLNAIVQLYKALGGGW
ncbi:MAG TPA: TolC family protein [Panacibacter sp.]|nr:TolC family protein [Panacibacter sp.]